MRGTRPPVISAGWFGALDPLKATAGPTLLVFVAFPRFPPPSRRTHTHRHNGRRPQDVPRAGLPRAAQLPLYVASWGATSSPPLAKLTSPTATAIVANGFIHCSGALPVTPDGKMVEGTFGEKVVS